MQGIEGKDDLAPVSQRAELDISILWKLGGALGAGESREAARWALRAHGDVALGVREHADAGEEDDGVGADEA